MNIVKIIDFVTDKSDFMIHRSAEFGEFMIFDFWGDF